MIVHLFPSEKFTKSFIYTMNEWFPRSLNCFFVYNYDEEAEKKYELKEIESENVILIGSLLEVKQKSEYIKKINSADKIIVHSLFYWKEIDAFSNSWKKKLCIVFWGGDLQQLVVKPKNSFLKLLRYYFEKKKMTNLISKSCAVATLLSGDYDLLASCVNLNGKKAYTAMYLNSEYEPEAIYNKFFRNNTEKPWNILVGNNAAETNQHIEVFQALRKFDIKDIRVVVPLSYPVSKDKTYLKEVINKGKELFGESFVPLTDYMKFDEYVEILSKCRIAIFNNTRQQALGNIELMTLLGGKVYIRNDNVMWKEFVLKEKMKFYPFESIKSSSLNEFIEYDVETQSKNVSLMIKYMSKTRFFSIWNEIFKD